MLELIMSVGGVIFGCMSGVGALGNIINNRRNRKKVKKEQQETFNKIVEINKKNDKINNNVEQLLSVIGVEFIEDNKTTEKDLSPYDENDENNEMYLYNNPYKSPNDSERSIINVEGVKYDKKEGNLILPEHFYNKHINK
jgi:hypothetical protein